jgi:hypothetical protein
MPRVVLQSTTPVFGRTKNVYALDSAAAVIGGEIEVLKRKLAPEPYSPPQDPQDLT